MYINLIFIYANQGNYIFATLSSLCLKKGNRATKYNTNFIPICNESTTDSNTYLMKLLVDILDEVLASVPSGLFCVRSKIISAMSPYSSSYINKHSPTLPKVSLETMTVIGCVPGLLA